MEVVEYLLRTNRDTNTAVVVGNRVPKQQQCVTIAFAKLFMTFTLFMRALQLPYIHNGGAFVLQFSHGGTSGISF